jgi:hypothetical protein
MPISSAVTPDDAVVNVVCMKWGTLYSAEYVNALFRGVRQHLSLKHRFVCFTDNADEIDDGVEIRPIPRLTLPDGKEDLRWRKLTLFSNPLDDLVGPTLFLDLDLVIFGALDVFFTQAGSVPIIRDAELFRSKRLRALLQPNRHRFLEMVGNSSVFRFRAGSHDHVLKRFAADPAAATSAYKISQQFQSACLADAGELSYWPKDWCVSFKNACVPRGFASLMNNPTLPKEARIVVFAGEPKMTEVLAGGGQKWYRRIGNVDWLKAAWNG